MMAKPVRWDDETTARFVQAAKNMSNAQLCKAFNLSMTTVKTYKCNLGLTRPHSMPSAKKPPTSGFVMPKVNDYTTRFERVLPRMMS